MRLIILDRDGVINEDSEDYIRSLADWRPIPGSLEAIAALSKAGYTIAVATNQSGLGRGYLVEIVLAIVQLKEGEIMIEEEVIAFAKSKLSLYKVPKKVIFADIY